MIEHIDICEYLINGPCIDGPISKYTDHSFGAIYLYILHWNKILSSLTLAHGVGQYTYHQQILINPVHVIPHLIVQISLIGDNKLY